ncbi:Shedu immune nuclease family protein [Cellulophaga baltica]|uniref:Shedu immune nuclease family protein n=1 Tax=Cellulophaga baltica TaxID=76594 RepID=UPI0024944EF3|nr:Shedu immune nuclease family protein [Cellulophaga baltica]
MIEIVKTKNELILKYSYTDYSSVFWVDKKLNSSKPFNIQHIFNVSKDILIERIENEYQEPEYYKFKIGTLINEYFEIDKTVFGLKNNFYFFKDCDLDEVHFFASSKISILNQIDRQISKEIFIGGPKEDILPFESFNELVKIFPTSHEITLYREAKVTSILTEYFSNIIDKEEKYTSYINKKTPVSKSKIRKIFKEADILKYQTLLEKLKSMLSNEIKFSEKQWQEEILQIILLLFPKYIAVFDEVKFKDTNNQNRRLDYGIIDFMGNLDLIEIKIPFDKSIVSVRTYRDNHIPNRDLSGAIMQIEKYIYYLNKSGNAGERKLTEKYKNELPEGIEIKITNPNGLIIMGRDINLNNRQLNDFEIIKRKYKNIIDIFTYDDLIRRMEIMIEQLKKI